METQEAIIQALKESILKVWAFEKKLQLTVDITTKEIEEIAEEMEMMTGEKLEKYEAMLKAAKESNQQAARQLENVKARHKSLRSKLHQELN